MTPPFVPSGQQLFVEQECLSAARLVFCLSQRKRQRLSTLYQDRAGVTLEPRPLGGSRVTVRIPRGEATKTV